MCNTNLASVEVASVTSSVRVSADDDDDGGVVGDGVEVEVELP